MLTCTAIKTTVIKELQNPYILLLMRPGFPNEQTLCTYTEVDLIVVDPANHDICRYHTSVLWQTKSHIPQCVSLDLKPDVCSVEAPSNNDT